MRKWGLKIPARTKQDQAKLAERRQRRTLQAIILMGGMGGGGLGSGGFGGFHDRGSTIHTRTCTRTPPAHLSAPSMAAKYTKGNRFHVV